MPQTSVEPAAWCTPRSRDHALNGVNLLRPAARAGVSWRKADCNAVPEQSLKQCFLQDDLEGES